MSTEKRSTYKVEMNGDEYEVTFLSENGSALLNGEPVNLSVEPKSVPDHYSLLVDGKSLLLAIEPDGEIGRYRVSTGGHDFMVDVASEREAFLREYLRAAGVGARQGRVTAPMPGKIVKVEAKQGDAVGEYQGVVIMEAMKMENEIKSPLAGKLLAVHVKEGQAVEKGQILFEVE